MVAHGYYYFQVIMVSKDDFRASLRIMYFVLKEKMAFRKYNSLLELMASLNVVTSKDTSPANANLRGEAIKNDLIEVLGMTLIQPFNFLIT